MCHVLFKLFYCFKYLKRGFFLLFCPLSIFIILFQNSKHSWKIQEGLVVYWWDALYNQIPRGNPLQYPKDGMAWGIMPVVPCQQNYERRSSKNTWIYMKTRLKRHLWVIKMDSSLSLMHCWNDATGSKSFSKCPVYTTGMMLEILAGALILAGAKKHLSLQPGYDV